jgi:hypothetical protein
MSRYCSKKQQDKCSAAVAISTLHVVIFNTGRLSNAGQVIRALGLDHPRYARLAEVEEYPDVAELIWTMLREQHAEDIEENGSGVRGGLRWP